MSGLRLFLFVCLLFMCQFLFANNVRVGTVRWNDRDAFQGKPVLDLTLTISWDNSWRDDYNWDAVYVFLKYRLKSGGTGAWHPLYIDSGSCDNGNLVCELAPGGPGDKGIGLFIYRHTSGHGSVSTTLKLQWTLAGNTSEPVDRSDFSSTSVQVVASAIEMIWVPRGPFRVGDSYSRNTFWRDYIPFPSFGDLISESSTLFATSGDAYAAADHVGGSVGDTTSCWIPTAGNSAEWYADFSDIGRRTIRYFGFCGAKGSAIPPAWRLEATNNMETGPWTILYSGTASDWVEALNTAYPLEHTFAIPADKLTKSYYFYRFVIPSFTGTVAIKSISMTDEDLPLARDHSVLIDGPTVLLDRQRHLGAMDGGVWNGGTTSSAYPTGYGEYYAMKYELSQEQYVDFLNRLSLVQQKALLPHASTLSEGDYLFGSPASPTCRNGIILERKPSGEPMVFACNLNPSNVPGSVDDGQTLACNYISIKDLLAYASWSGLRPLSELEYEKLCRPLYNYDVLPQEGEYAWNSLDLIAPSEIENAGCRNEHSAGNANYGGTVMGPLRCGIFAGSHAAGNLASRSRSGSGYWGGQELSGNLRELYYNVNPDGRVFRGLGFENHGNGYVSVSGGPVPTGWPSVVAAFALRGGSFASEETGELAVSDRRYHQNALDTDVSRDSTVGIRLGRSCVMDQGVVVENTLRMENGQVSSGTMLAVDTVVDGSDYFIEGSGAAVVGPVYTVLWYKNEDNSAEWSLLDGFTDKDLALKGVVGKYGRNGRMREYRYRRRVIVPTAETESEVVLRVVDTTYTIDRRRETLVYGGNSHGITVTAKSAGLVAEWVDLKSGKILSATNTTATTSYYRAHCSDFPDLVWGEERQIEVKTTIYGRWEYKDTVVYVIPAPELTFDKLEMTIAYDGSAGVTLTANHLVSVTWTDVKSGQVLLKQTNVRSSYCHPKWVDFSAPQIEERRTVRVDIVSTEACYSREESITMILPPRAEVKLDASGYRCWSDGTYARSAKEYRNPNPPYFYQGDTGSGIYRIDPDGPGGQAAFDVYCDMVNHGGGWVLIFKSIWRADNALYYWADKNPRQYNENNVTADLYSILYLMDQLKPTASKYYFWLDYPELKVHNIWKQSKNPETFNNTNMVQADGYEAISIMRTENGWGGLSKGTESTCYLEGTFNSTNWYYAIATKMLWSTSMPGPSEAVKQVWLWMKDE